jgi:hypothetical protein
MVSKKGLDQAIDEVVLNSLTSMCKLGVNDGCTLAKSQRIELMELIKLLQEGDATGLEMQKAQEALELAKHAVEQAKERLELSKGFFDQVLSRAEEAGIPRAKFKKLVEERVAGLWNSGLIAQAEAGPLKTVKAARPAKKVKESASGDAGERGTDNSADMMGDFSGALADGNSSGNFSESAQELAN